MNFVKILRKHFAGVNKFEGASKVNVNVGNVFVKNDKPYQFGLVCNRINTD
jgi:hypothetical protein